MSTIEKDFRITFSILYLKNKKKDSLVETEVIPQLWYDEKIDSGVSHLVYVTYRVSYKPAKGYSIMADKVYHEGESVHDQDNEEVYEHEQAEITQRMAIRKTQKLVRDFAFVFDKDDGIFHKRDDTDYENMMSFLSALFSDNKKKEQKKVDAVLTKIIDHYSSGKKRDNNLLETLNSFVAIPGNKSIELLKTIAVLKRSTSKLERVKVHTPTDVLHYFFTELQSITIPDTGVKKERIFVLSITDVSQKDGASIYYIPVDALRKKNKKLLENLEFGEENWLSILKNVKIQEEDALEILNAIDVGDKLTEDDYNYKIVDTLSFWFD